MPPRSQNRAVWLFYAAVCPSYNLTREPSIWLTTLKRTATELARGDLEQVMIKGNNGYVLLIHAGPEAVLSVIVRKEAKLGLVFLDASRAAKAAGELL